MSRCKTFLFIIFLLVTALLFPWRGIITRTISLMFISMAMDQEPLVYGRLSFGPGRRYASKGCYIVKLSKGPKPELIRMSEWVIY